ncbi:MAG: SDR family oxidoreductase [Clostridiales bacterium]|jgi:NAD(P)-dependent dehydrogenase (short-subunit alcohol dehydrogenase family)|nr:SDR family oxidoreductase [Clostridiales bacterium]
MDLDYIRGILCLDRKKALVTGGNSGIGRGIARSLTAFGAEVSIVGRDRRSLDETARELRELGGFGKAYQADISDKTELDRVFDAYAADFDETLDILAANAGVSFFKSALDTTEDEVDTLINTNLKGVLFCCQRAAEMMKKRMNGCIIITTSVNALYPLPSQALYTATKAAQEALKECLAVDLGPYGIRVNNIAPGAVKSNLARNFNFPPPSPEDSSEKPRRMELPLGRVGEPDDIGDVVACMASDAFKYMTGSTVLVDGGLKLRYK